MVYVVHGYWWATFESKTYGPFQAKSDAQKHLAFLQMAHV